MMSALHPAWKLLMIKASHSATLPDKISSNRSAPVAFARSLSLRSAAWASLSPSSTQAAAAGLVGGSRGRQGLLQLQTSLLRLSAQHVLHPGYQLRLWCALATLQKQQQVLWGQLSQVQEQELESAVFSEFLLWGNGHFGT
jgi:hypothetical protein